MAENTGLGHRLLRLLELVHLGAWVWKVAGGGAAVSGVVLVWGVMQQEGAWVVGAAIGLVFCVVLLLLGWISARVKRRQEAEATRKSIEAAVEAGQWLLRIGRWVYGPKTAEGVGRTHIEVGDASIAFDRAVTVYRGPDAATVRKLSDEIRKASSSRDAGARLNPLLDDLEKWVVWAETEYLQIKRHPLEKRP